MDYWHDDLKAPGSFPTGDNFLAEFNSSPCKPLPCLYNLGKTRVVYKSNLNSQQLRGSVLSHTTLRKCQYNYLNAKPII